MSVAIPPSSSSSPRSISQETRSPSNQPSPVTSIPSTHIHDSTLLTTFESTTTTSHSHRAHIFEQPGKLGLSLSAPHPDPLAVSSSIHSVALPISHMTSSDPVKATAHPFPSAAAAVPVAADHALHGVDHGVSPVINAFRSPYPPSPSYFVTVVPPDNFPISPESSQHERDRLQRGSLLPLYPTLGGQLWAISREFALPSLGGLMLYLADDGQGNRGPRIGDVAWQALWSRYFVEEEAPSTTAYKGATGLTPSRRSSTLAGDSFADPLSSSSAHAADLSRSTLGEGSSSRPSIPYVSSRPSPRADTLGFSRRDVSADWSPSARSAAWSGHAPSSAGRGSASAAPFPRLPILARIEWQVDSNKASWWPSWIASRSAVREQRPSHKTRKSMHLANNLSQSRDHDELQAHDDDKQEEQQDEIPQSATRELDAHTREIQFERVEPAEAAPTAFRALSPVQSGPSDSNAFIAAIPAANSGHEKEPSLHSSAPSSPTPSLRQTDVDTAASVKEEDQAAFEQSREVSVAELASGRASPSDEPLRSARASIVSMSSEGSGRTTTTSRSSVKPAAQETAAAASTSSIDAASRSASPHPRVESSAALLNHNDASDHSRTGYSEILDAGAGDDDDTGHDASFSREALSLAHDGDYSALPDSPSSDAHEMADRPTVSADEQETFPHEGFPLRHSFIVDAGDEAMWRDLQHHGMDQMFPEPREESEAPPAHDPRHESNHFLEEETHAEAHENEFELVQGSGRDGAIQQQHPTQHQWSSSTAMQAPRELQEQQQHYAHPDDFAQDAYYSPQRSNMARIQSWIGKTPTGRPNSSGGFDDDFGQDAYEDESQLPKESDFDEVVGLWASKVREDPYGVPHINSPTASVTGDGDDRASVSASQRNVQAEEMQDRAVEQHHGEASLDAAPVPAFSLLSPIHLDAAAFGGVKPQLGNLTVPLSPQLLSPTAVGDAFNTPRAISPVQRSVSTPTVQQHPPSSPSSLAPPQDRRPSSASRRSSGDLSDSLEEMQKALELLSPGCSPNPGRGPSPDPQFRKMSSRDSLAYARSLSASVTPSPKWIARAKAATVKSSRSNAKSTFAAGGSPFDREQVSPRPASTSAMSSSRARSPGFRAPFSASRLIEFSKADTMPRLARTEGGDADSIRSRDTVSDDVTEPAAPAAAMPSAELLAQNFSPSAEYEAAHIESVTAATPKAEERQLDDFEPETITALPTEGVEISTKVATAESSELVEASAVPTASHSKPLPPAPATETEGEHTQELTAFMGDDHDDGIASIQRFLRGKVFSADSDASLSHDLSASVTEQQQEASTDDTIIERSASLESDLRTATPQPCASQTDYAELADPKEEMIEPITDQDPQVIREEMGSNERWSQVSYITGQCSSHHPSGYSLNSNSPKRDLHHEVRTPSFTYDTHLSSEPTTVDTQLSSASAEGEGLSVAGEVVKSYLSSSPSDETFFISGPSVAPVPQEQQQSAGREANQNVEQQQQLAYENHGGGDEVEQQGVPAAESAASPSIPALAYRFASSPIHTDTFPVHRPLAGTHDYSLDEDEIRTMNEDTRAAVREALSQSTAHHVNILPAIAPISSAPLSPKSSASPTSPISSHSSLGDQFRRRGSASSLNLTSAGGGSGSNASSPHLNGSVGSANKRRPARLNLDIDGLTRSPPAAATTAAARRLPSTSPRSRFGALPPSPSLHPSYKAAASSPLSQSFPVMGGGMGSPQGKGFLPSLASVTSIEGELAG
ncbi:uncharacterized protein UTRI_04963 [Ustilago trichophora]|uniref:Proteophosphoglycan ppg4 n=1 Tax=Ustilago trichophora TaxID=86804 RepID=A0A5C3ECA6_9BASI|nr:uncharacterized protein UTRI_04963 [Ustilago trichophora]